MARPGILDEGSSSLPPVTIPQFYTGQNVFLTGGTGFIGKILVEKLLWSCPGIGNIYMLVRTRRGKNPHDRLLEYKENVIFERLKKTRPEDLEKLKIIEGDQAMLGLGLSSEDRQLLSERANIVFHAAASIRFNDPLKKATFCNTRGTLEVVKLALEMKHLKVLVHVSTAYSNCDRFHVEEKLYQPPMDWRSLITATETLDSFQLDVITKKLLGRKPNTYVFTKSLAEAVINDYKHLIPALIVRPSVVTPPFREPLPGYVESFKGPAGIMAALETGAALVFLLDTDVATDHVPVDAAAMGTITAAWRRAHQEPGELPVYNCCGQGRMKETTYGDMKDMSISISQHISLSPVYYPLNIFTNNILLFFTLFYGLQLPMAILVDTILRLSGKTPRLVTIQRKFFVAVIVLRFFTHNTWIFSTELFGKLNKELYPSDVSHFRINIYPKDIYNYCVVCKLVGRKLLLKETTTLEQNARAVKILYWVHLTICATGCFILYWFFTTYSIPQKLMYLMTRIIRTILVL